MSKYYFTKEHEEAIVEYNNTEDLKKRDELYEFIEPALDKLIESVVYTYKFHNLPNIASLMDDCKVEVTMILNKYDENNGSAAFSYFTVIVRNWFFAETKKRSRKVSRESSYDDIPKHVEDDLVVQNEYETGREKNEFIHFLLKEIETWDSGRRGDLLGKNDIKVVKALKILFNHANEIDIFSKKGIYQNLRDMTGLNTKQITRSIKKLEERYLKFIKSWIDGDIETHYEWYSNND